MLAHKRFFFILLVCVVLSGIVHAQTPTQVVINYPEVTDSEDSMSLGLYFTVTDSGGQVVTNAQVSSASIVLEDGTRYETQPTQPTSPFYIVLVLDASGSMSSAAEPMRQAAIQAVNDAPQEAQFAVIRFNQTVDQLEGFTSDHNRVINAIGQVQPVNRSGTCLYDGAYQAIELLRTVPAGRRAVILFTDGKDETLEGNPCSTHTYDQVVEFANIAQSRVPIHTIGLSTSEQNINSAELRNLANSTGGLFAIGEQQTLAQLFTQIMDALKSQWLAQTPICPTQGQHTATLIVMLQDGTALQPAVTSFESSRDCFVPTPTPTPINVSLEIGAVQVDLADETVSLDVTVNGEQAISEYRFEFVDAETNLLLDRATIPAPLPHPVLLPGDNLMGSVRVTVRAVDANGNFFEWPTRGTETTDRAEYEFSYVRPTPTPTLAAATAIPVSVAVDGVAYDPARDVIVVDLSYTGQEQIDSLEIRLLNAESNLRESVFNVEPDETIELSTDELTPGQDYSIYVIAQNSTGQNLSRAESDEFSYAPPMTPTPTSTATPLPPQARIGSVSPDEENQEIVVGILSENENQIARYEIQLQDTESGLVLGNFVHTPPPYDTIRIPLRTLQGGQYTAILRVYGLDGSLILEADPINFVYNPPPTPTPMPSLTPTPTEAPAPGPSFPERVTDSVRDNPLLTLVIAVIGFGLAGLLVVLLRPRKRPETGTGFLSEQTGFYQMPGGKAPVEQATDVFSQALLPAATLTMTRFPDAIRVGQQIKIDHVPFKIGRSLQEKNDIVLEADTSISRFHAEITYDNGTFYLTDQKSSNGTSINTVRLAPNVPTPIPAGAQIQFGIGTQMTFDMKRSSANDPDKTDYYQLDDLTRQN